MALAQKRCNIDRLSAQPNETLQRGITEKRISDAKG